jgi:hypothetical protein
MQRVETSKGSLFNDAIYLGTTDYWYIKVYGVIQSEELRNYFEVKSKIEKVEKEARLHKVLNALDKPWISVGTEGHCDYDRKQKSVSIFSHLYGSTLHDIIKTYTPTEDESISCKDKSSGVKCNKIKKSNYFKPFYQTSRF